MTPEEPIRPGPAVPVQDRMQVRAAGTIGVTALPADPTEQLRAHLPALVGDSIWGSQEAGTPTYA